MVRSILLGAALLAQTALIAASPVVILGRDIGGQCTGPHGAGTWQKADDCKGISLPEKTCPKDKSGVQCCVEIKCSADGGEGLCRSVKKNGCSKGEFHPGACPGNDDIQCCIQDCEDEPEPEPQSTTCTEEQGGSSTAYPTSAAPTTSAAYPTSAYPSSAYPSSAYPTDSDSAPPTHHSKTKTGKESKTKTQPTETKTKTKPTETKKPKPTTSKSTSKPAPPATTAHSTSAPAATSVPGFDISGYQPNVDFSAAYKDGARFVIMKATEGTTYQSSVFSKQWKGSTDAGFIRGAYHFAQPGSSSGASQAKYFIAHGGNWSGDGKTLPGMLDIEYNYKGPTCYGVSQAGMVSWIEDFVDTYHTATGRYPMIYSTTDWWTRCTGNTPKLGDKSALVLANYNGSPGKMPAGWKYQSIWQNNDHYPHGGDSDTFNGSLEQLKQLATG